MIVRSEVIIVIVLVWVSLLDIFGLIIFIWWKFMLLLVKMVCIWLIIVCCVSLFLGCFFIWIRILFGVLNF